MSVQASLPRVGGCGSSRLDFVRMISAPLAAKNPQRHVSAAAQIESQISDAVVVVAQAIHELESPLEEESFVLAVAQLFALPRS